MHILPNGLTVAVDPLPGAQSVSLGLYAGVGSRSEPAALSGLAHLVEHMVFKGAGGRDTRALAEVIEDVGGALNAWTARDQTVFHGRALARDTELVAELIADLVRAPAFRRRSSRAREAGDPVGAWRKSSISPDDLVHDHLFEAAFAGQAIGRPVLGNEQTVRAAGRQDCVDWLQQQFVPERLVLAASGKVDPASSPEARRAAVRRHGARTTSRRPMQRISLAEPATTSAALNRHIGALRSKACRRAIRPIPHWPCSSRRLAAALRHGCSRSFARNAAWLIRSMPGTRPLPIPGWSESAAPPIAGKPRNRCNSRGTCSRRDDGEPDRRRAQSSARPGRSRFADGPRNRTRPRRSDGALDRGVRPNTHARRIAWTDPRRQRRRRARARGQRLLDGPAAVASVGAKLALAA